MPSTDRVPSRRRWVSLLGATALVAACASTPEPVEWPDVVAGPTVDVETTEGVVRGVTQGDLHVFKGIPYAAPVSGVDRWRPPQPPAKRDNVFDASQWGLACEQTVATIPNWMLTEAGEVALYEMSDLQGFNAQEKGGDCLNLNIWTPQLPDPNAPEAAPAAAAAPEAAAPEAAAPEAAAPEAAAPEVAPAPNDAAPTAEAPADGAAVPAAQTPVDGAASPTAEAPADGTAASADTPLAKTPAAPNEAAAEPPPAPAAPEAPQGLPVIVHLHGGGLTSGSAKHRAQDGSLIAKKGVIFVTANYRLGAIGFMAGDGLFEGDVMAGNRGMMDTVRALEWVRDNIKKFGGDPDNVTLMGQSGGGTNVWTTLASPKSEGLVRRAIIMSGPIYEYPIEDHKKLTTAVLEDWGAKVGDTESLAKISTEDAISTATTTTVATGGDEFGEMSKTYLPSAGAHGTDFLPDDTLTAVQKGRLDKIDLLVGNCDDDAKVSIIMVPIPNYFAIDIWNGYIGGMVAPDDDGFDKMTEAYIEALPEYSSTRAKEQLQTDALYRIRALKAAAIHSERTKDPALGKTYTYSFDWKSPSFPEDLAAMHGMDLIFASGNIAPFKKALGHRDGKIDPVTQNLSDAMIEAWTNFAKTGTPSSDKLPEWTEYETGARNTMVFDKESKVVSDPRGNLRKLWE